MFFAVFPGFVCDLFEIKVDIFKLTVSLLRLSEDFCIVLQVSTILNDLIVRPYIEMIEFI